MLMEMVGELVLCVGRHVSSGDDSIVQHENAVVAGRGGVCERMPAHHRPCGPAGGVWDDRVQKIGVAVTGVRCWRTLCVTVAVHTAAARAE